jgi:hypothetical protein
MSRNRIATAAAIKRLKAAEKELEAISASEGCDTPRGNAANRRVAAAEADPDLPPRYLDPRDRAHAETLRCKCQKPKANADGRCITCGMGI